MQSTRKTKGLKTLFLRSRSFVQTVPWMSCSSRFHWRSDVNRDFSNLIRCPPCVRYRINKFVYIVLSLGYNFPVLPPPRNTDLAEAQRHKPFTHWFSLHKEALTLTALFSHPCCLIISETLLCGGAWSCGVCRHPMPPLCGKHDTLISIQAFEEKSFILTINI